MWFHAKGSLILVLLCLAAIPATLAQEKRGRSNEGDQVTCEDLTRKDPGLQQNLAGSKPLTPAEGLAILGAALDSRHHAEFLSDCSHFVHGLYERAGFPYDYASSVELYAGIAEFQRVASPQSGDLAVWRGHAGIV